MEAAFGRLDWRRFFAGGFESGDVVVGCSFVLERPLDAGSMDCVLRSTLRRAGTRPPLLLPLPPPLPPRP